MMKCREVMEQLEVIAPLRYACSWDNPGLLVGKSNKEVRTIMLTLDVTDEIIEEAINNQIDMIVSHHPLIFSPLSKINDSDFIANRVMKLIQHDIACYAMHTNFDIAPGGMGDLAGEKLGIKKVAPVDITGNEENVSYGIGNIGTVEDTTVELLAKKVKEVFNLPYVQIYGSKQIKKPINRIAISPGAGTGMWKEARNGGAQVLITGDMKHHEGIDASANGLAVIDAGHFGIEHIFCQYLKEQLDLIFQGEVTVLKGKQVFPTELIF